MALAVEQKGPPFQAANEGDRARLERRSVWVLGGIVLLGAAIRFSTLGQQSFWLDEAVTWHIVANGLGHVLTAVPRTESTPPLYYILLWLWSRAFGLSEFGLRSFSALCGTLAIPVMWAVGRRMASARVGTIAALLTAVNPLLFWYSQEARAYQLMLVLSAASLLALVWAIERPTNRRVLAWGVIAAAALCSHYFAALVIVPEALWLLDRLRRVGRLSAGRAVLGLGPPAIMGAALLPLLIHQNDGRASWLVTQGGSLPHRLIQVAKEDMIGQGQPAKALLTAIAALVVALALARLLSRSEHRERERALLPLWVGAGGVLVAVLVSALATDYLNARNLLSTWPALAMVVAIGLGAERARRVGLVGTTVLTLLGLVCIANVVRDPRFQRDDWRDAAHALDAAASTRAVVSDVHLQPPLKPYLQHLSPYPAGGIALTEVDVIWLRRRGNWEPLIPVTPAPLTGFTMREIRTASYIDLRYTTARPRVEPAASLGALYPEPTSAVVLAQRP
ncbi:MAG: glycosyltransferase family 39 protein [Solirubrobacteraceae bacterium]